MEWLRGRGARTLYFKYCSTFDSTPAGNIGPVIDAVLDRYDWPFTVICPALLPNRRMVRDAILYVDGVPLAQSPMKDHPLNPMWESDIRRLMQPQGKYPCFAVTGAMLEQGRRGVMQDVSEYAALNKRFYLSLDYYLPVHGQIITEIFGELPFLTGGSGLAGDLAAYLRPSGRAAALPLSRLTAEGLSFPAAVR